ncbi:hypothetical protein Tco_0928799 [Tanacetum coccineum]
MLKESTRRLSEIHRYPKVEDVSLVDGVFDGALGGYGDEDFAIGEGWEKECLHERYLHHSHHHLHQRNERMMDDRRRRKRKQKWKDDLFSCLNPFTSFTHSEEREDR